jgi:hypothetical protein
VERSWINLYKRKNEKNNVASFAPGMDDQEELEQNASKEEVKKGEYTSVTTLSFDEVDPS